MPEPVTGQPVFLDPEGGRARGWRRFSIAVGVLATVLGAVLVIGVAIPPLVPSLPIDHRLLPPVAVTRDQRERLAIRRSLAHVFRPAPPARRGRFAPPGGSRLVARRGTPSNPIVAGFFVNWQDNSLAALNQHINDLDWVVCEWSFLAPAGDSIDFEINHWLFDVVRKPSVRSPPAILIMLSNFDRRTVGPTAKRFNVSALRTFLSSPANRARGVAQLVDIVERDSLAGVTIDFEDVPDDLQGPALTFTHDLRAALLPLKRIVTTAVPSYTKAHALQRIAAENDFVFAMLFDEHYGGGVPGPVASQQFYVDQARRMTAVVGTDKIILMVGAYGYNWHDDGSGSDAMTFQETMEAARDNHVATHFDPASLNPYISWTDPDSTDHVVWYLDGVTAYNSFRVAKELGVAGVAIRRLGQEDGSLWAVLGRSGLIAGPDSLYVLPSGYEVEFVNDIVCGPKRTAAAVVGGQHECPPDEEPDSGGDISGSASGRRPDAERWSSTP